VLDIAPLIIVSLVQHCCEQSLLSLQQKLTVNIEIEAEDSQLTFKLSCNGSHETINGLPQLNSALNQALKRVELLYPAKHRLETSLQDGIFSLRLFLESDIVTAELNNKPEIVLAYEPA
jgi:LytS/YehU family sensor histidine kinase